MSASIFGAPKPNLTGDSSCPHAAYSRGMCIHCGRVSNRSIERIRRKEEGERERASKPRRQMGLYEMLVDKVGFDSDGNSQ